MDGPENTAHTPHILIFQITAIGPTIDFHGELIGAGMERIGEVEFGRWAAVLAEADPRAVYPEIEGAADAIEMDVHATALPAERQVEGPPIRADRIAAGM